MLGKHFEHLKMCNSILLGSTTASIPHPAGPWADEGGTALATSKLTSTLLRVSDPPLGMARHVGWEKMGFKENKMQKHLQMAFFRGQWWLRETLDWQEGGTRSQEHCRVTSSQLTHKCCQSKTKSAGIHSKHHFPELHLNTWCRAPLLEEGNRPALSPPPKTKTSVCTQALWSLANHQILQQYFTSCFFPATRISEGTIYLYISISICYLKWRFSWLTPEKKTELRGRDPEWG